MNIYPRESVEFQPAPIYQNGLLITTAIAYSVVAFGARAGAFTAAITLQGATGFMVTGYSVGTYDVWAQVTSAPETPVLYCGSFQVS